MGSNIGHFLSYKRQQTAIIPAFLRNLPFFVNNSTPSPRSISTSSGVSSFSLFVVCTLLLLPASMLAQLVIQGSVVSEEGTPLPGASLVVVGTSKGVYTLRDGKFRLPLSSEEAVIKITSLGYRPIEIQLRAGTDTTITLAALPLSSKEVLVTADITPEEIIRRSRSRKEENIAKIRTYRAELYSKLLFELQGNVFNQIGEEDKGQVLETFSEVLQDNTTTPPSTAVTIKKRRQTANVPSDNNLLAIAEFVDFYRDEIPILNAIIPSPLGKTFEDDYTFSLLERRPSEYGIVYVIGVEPRSKIRPAFVGKVSITAEDYILVEVDVRPSAATAISFVRDLHYRQSFKEVEKGLWAPSLLSVTGKAKVEIIRGFAELDIDVSVESFFTEIHLNVPLPDTAFTKKKAIDSLAVKQQEESVSRRRRTLFTVETAADSADTTFWATRNVAPLTEREQELYRRIDSLTVLSKDTSAGGGSPLSFTPYPVLYFNRTASYSLGAGSVIGLGNFSLDVWGMYSWGQKRPYGSATLKYSPFRRRSFGLSVEGSVFSKITANIDDFDDLTASSRALFFEDDIRDYFKEEGVSAKISTRVSDFTVALEGKIAENTSLQNSVRMIWTDREYRPNPQIPEGIYTTGRIELQWNNPYNVLTINNRMRTTLRAGTSFEVGNIGDNTFYKAEGLVRVLQPTFSTGYLPMFAQVAIVGGVASSSTPIHRQFVLSPAAYFMPRFNHFPTAPGGIFGGTQFIAVHAEHSFSDLLWRAVGLPLYEGRGLEFIITGKAASYSNFNEEKYYRETSSGPLLYEVGIGIGRIPIFISNVIYFRADFAYSFGADGFRDRLGLALALTSPF